MMTAAYVNGRAGGCFALGLKFAGSHHAGAYGVLMEELELFVRIALAAKADNGTSCRVDSVTAEQTLNSVAVGVALVMAGSGNLRLLRILRKLHGRTGVSYGSHMAIGACLGLLFAGGGSYALSTSNAAIGALLTAFFPVWPNSPDDNRYHCQAFRHLYVLALEKRVLEAIDVDSGQPVYVPLEVELKGTHYSVPSTLTLTTPTLLPDTALISALRIHSPRYWTSTFALASPTPSSVIGNGLLLDQGVVYVKRKAGFLPYADDPTNARSMLSRSLPLPRNPVLAAYARHLGGLSAHSDRYSDATSIILYDVLSRDKIDLLPSYLSVLSALDTLIRCVDTSSLPSPAEINDIAGLGLLRVYSNATHKAHDDPLFDPRFVAGIDAVVSGILLQHGFSLWNGIVTLAYYGLPPLPEHLLPVADALGSDLLSALALLYGHSIPWPVLFWYATQHVGP